MEMKGLIDGRFMGRTVALLSHALDYRSAKHAVISSNLANIDTPGHRPQELTFDQELRRAVDREGVPLRKTNEKHFPPSGGDLSGGKASHLLETQEAGWDGPNQLNIEREMAKMVQNNLLYEASAKLLSKKFEGLKAAIEGRR